MEPSVIKTMVSFVYIAILKDALIGFYCWIRFYRMRIERFVEEGDPTGKDFRIKSWLFNIGKLDYEFLFKDEPLRNSEIVYCGFVEGNISFVLEDFVEVCLQYFYFEKYSFMPVNSIVIFNALFMVLKALYLTVRTVIYLFYERQEKFLSNRLSKQIIENFQ